MREKGIKEEGLGEGIRYYKGRKKRKENLEERREG